MSNGNWEWVSYFFNFLMLLAVMILGTAAGTESKLKLTEFYVKKICWGLLIIGAIYFYTTVPFVGSYFEFSDKLQPPTTIKSVEEQEKYIKDHHFRVESLERELKETKEELKEIRTHYDRIVQIIFYAILYFGIFQILKKNNESIGGITGNNTK
jgi:hypothetical protein